MNSFSSSGIFVVLLFAYCTPTQGTVYPLLEARFENGISSVTNAELGTVTNLIKSSDGTYQIEETEQTRCWIEKSTVAGFGIEGIDTMVGKEVALRTDEKKGIQIKFVNLQDAQMLFNMTTGPKLGESHHSYSVSAVYQYQESDVLNDVSLSVFTYSTTGLPQRRFVIHSGDARFGSLVPHVLWTEKHFNYSFDGNDMIFILCPTLAIRKYKYLLVKFRDASSMNHFKEYNQQYCTSAIPLQPREIDQHFQNKDPTFQK